MFGSVRVKDYWKNMPQFYKTYIPYLVEHFFPSCMII